MFNPLSSAARLGTGGVKDDRLAASGARPRSTLASDALLSACGCIDSLTMLSPSTDAASRRSSMVSDR